MQITQMAKLLKVRTTLTRGVDYTEEDLESSFGTPLMELKVSALSRIAESNCFDKCSWSGHEHDNKIEAIFIKEI